MDSNDTLNEAIKLIDPEGMLQPGSRQYDSIRDMLQTCTVVPTTCHLRHLDEFGPAEALDMARDSAKSLKTWWKVL